jgi:hypothetical protein
MEEGPMSEFYRVDTFSVPAAARAEFLSNVARIQDVLRRQRGLRDAVVLERRSGASRHDVVTVARWAADTDLAAVQAAVAASNAAAGFDTDVFRARAGVVADTGEFVPLGLGT